MRTRRPPTPDRPIPRSAGTILFLLLILAGCGEALLGPGQQPQPPDEPDSPHFQSGAIASTILICFQYEFNDESVVWRCITEGDPIGLEICENYATPPDCILEDVGQEPQWSPQDTIGGDPPGSGDGILEAPPCDDDDSICEGTDPPELICPTSVTFGQVAQCQLNLNGNAVAGTQWHVSGPDLGYTRTSGGEGIVQQFWGGKAVADFEVSVDIWLFDGGGSGNNLHWDVLESGMITVTRSAAQGWSSTSDWSVTEDVSTPCSIADADPNLLNANLGVTYGKDYGCLSNRIIAPDYTNQQGLVTDSVTTGWQEGLHYVVSSSYKLEFATRINPHLSSSFAADTHYVADQPMGYYTQICPEGPWYTFYEMNANCGASNFGNLRDSVVAHELRHATRGQDTMTATGVDPRVAVWELVGESKSLLLDSAEDEVSEIDAAIKGYVDLLDSSVYDPRYTPSATPLWGGEVTIWNSTLGEWHVLDEVYIQWDGGGAP